MAPLLIKKPGFIFVTVAACAVFVGRSLWDLVALQAVMLLALELGNQIVSSFEGEQ